MLSLTNNEVTVLRAISNGKVEVAKNSENRIVPMLDPLKKYLVRVGYQEELDSDDWLFKSPRNNHTSCEARHYYDASSFRRRFKKLLHDIGVEHRGFYELKHSFATSMLNAGIPITTISKMLGHKTVEITMKHYIKQRKYSDEDIEKAHAYFRDHLSIYK